MANDWNIRLARKINECNKQSPFKNSDPRELLNPKESTKLSKIAFLLGKLLKNELVLNYQDEFKEQLGIFKRTDNDEYSTVEYPSNENGLSLSLKIPKPPSSMPIESFNTGAIFAWPSEEILANWCIKHSDIFKGKRVLELGGGGCPLAGLFISISSEAEELSLTDGNENNVRTAQTTLNINKQKIKCLNTKSSILKWGDELPESLRHYYDIIIAADILCFRGQDDLIDCIDWLLKPDQESFVSIVAPNRKFTSSTLSTFRDLAIAKFDVTIEEQSDPLVVSYLEKRRQQKNFIPEKHIPLTLTMKRINSN